MCWALPGPWEREGETLPGPEQEHCRGYGDGQRPATVTDRFSYSRDTAWATAATLLGYTKNTAGTTSGTHPSSSWAIPPVHPVPYYTLYATARSGMEEAPGSTELLIMKNKEDVYAECSSPSSLVGYAAQDVPLLPARINKDWIPHGELRLRRLMDSSSHSVVPSAQSCT